MSLYEYLSIKLKELTALFPCTVVQACPALKLIKNLLATVEHESIAPDYDESTKQQFREICAELHQMIVATELIVSSSQKVENPEKSLYETAEKLVDFIEGHLTSTENLWSPSKKSLCSQELRIPVKIAIVKRGQTAAQKLLRPSLDP
jgi:ribosomal protein S8